MTNEELAEHWKVSPNDAKNISNIINYLYSVELTSKHKIPSDVWPVVLRANDGKNNYISMEEGTDFYDKNQAIILGTHWARKIKIPFGQAKLMGVPEDAFLAINPINGYHQAIEQQCDLIRRTVHLNRQYD